MFGELAQYSGGMALFAHNCATSVQPGTYNQANGIPATTERILRARLQKATAVGRGVDTYDQSMSARGIFHQLGSGVPVNPFAKSELLY